MRKPTGIRFSEDEYEKISQYANEHEMSFSNVVRDAVRCYLNSDSKTGYLSLCDIAEGRGGEDLHLAFGQFLDDFNHAVDKAALIADEPQWSLEDAGRYYYDFAAAAHMLADENGLPVPPWCLKAFYFANEPYYAFDTQDAQFRAYLEESTPREFAWHGLFLGPNILQRA